MNAINQFASAKSLCLHVEFVKADAIYFPVKLSARVFPDGNAFAGSSFSWTGNGTEPVEAAGFKCFLPCLGGDKNRRP